jgi:hypothetical protein
VVQICSFVQTQQMLDMCRNLGFHIASDPQELSSAIVTLSLSG